VESLIQKSIDTGNVKLSKSDDPWIHFYLGGAYGYRGFNRFRKLNFIGAYRDAQRGIGHFEKALLKDSTLYDVYLGLGSYYYWRTAKSKFLRIIAFWIPDKRDLGLAQLKFSIEHGRYSMYDGIYVLLAAYYDHGDYDSGLQLALEAIRQKEGPNLSDRYFKAKFLAKKEQWPEVKLLFEQIYEIIKDHQYQSIGYQVECKYWIARVLSEEGKDQEALQLAREAISLSRKRNSDAEIEGHLDSFDEIKKDLEKLHAELSKRLSGK
jgi:tetratricopeptide (TPR) repeat protein